MKLKKRATADDLEAISFIVALASIIVGAFIGFIKADVLIVGVTFISGTTGFLCFVLIDLLKEIYMEAEP